MTGMVDPLTPDTVALAVELTIGQHRGDGGAWRLNACERCREDGSCPQLVWALSEQQASRERQAAFPT